MLCDISTFKNAIEESIALLDEEVIKGKNLKFEELEPIIKNIRDFLKLIKSDDINSYKELITHLENLNISNKKLIPLVGYLGKILDVIQLLKMNTSRNKNAKEYFKNSLNRTGHLYLFDELSNIKKEHFFKEIINSSALYTLLEISNLTYSNIINPISSLRNSMSDRLPEEYFSELLAGWFIEDIFIEKLKEKKVNIEQSSVDSSRKILFKKMKNMSIADINIIYKEESYEIELQRVGKATKPRKQDYYKTSLRKHKVKSSKILILWFGNEPKEIKKVNSFLYEKICMIKTIDIRNKKNKNIYFNEKKEELFLSKDYIEKNSILNWSSLKKITKEDLLKKLNIK